MHLTEVLITDATCEETEAADVVDTSSSWLERFDAENERRPRRRAVSAPVELADAL